MPTIQLPYHNDSQPLFDHIIHYPFACWLDSGKPHSSTGRFDILTAAPVTRWLHDKGNTQTLHYTYDAQLQTSACTTSQTKEDIFEQLQTANSALSPQTDALPFDGGIIACLSYDLGRQRMGIKQRSEAPCQLPALSAGLYLWAIVQDHQLGRCQLVYQPQLAQASIDTLCQALAQPAPTAPRLKTSTMQAQQSLESYTKALKKIDDYIHAGDCYQINFAQRFSGQYQGDPYAAYLALRKKMASPFSAYLNMGKNAQSQPQAVLSLSPERFIQVQNRQVLTQPIKGTSPRHQDPATDKQLAKQLKNSPKNQAENVMIVDLLRNDLGKHCLPGSIHVPKLFALEHFPNVHHLVSSICGTLRTDSNPWDLLKDSFPGGSITGAPKKRAMEIIEELEPCQRSAYCGSIVYYSANGTMDSNIAIRTVVCDGQQLHCWGGGGIVADSNINDEYQESLTKIHTILNILNTFT